jgi:hypothetical protein
MSKQLFDEHFLNLNVTLTLYPESKTVLFKTVEKFLEYITKEKEFWQSIHSEVSNKFQSIENIINTSLQNKDSNLEHAKNQIQQAINNASQSQWPTVYSKTSIAQYIKRQIEANSTQGEASIQYLIKRQLSNINSYEYFKGYMNAYIFEESAKAFNESAATQEETLAGLHNEYLGQLNSLNEDFHQITTGWKNEFDNKVTAWNDETKDFIETSTRWRETIEKDTKEELL